MGEKGMDEGGRSAADEARREVRPRVPRGEGVAPEGEPGGQGQPSGSSGPDVGEIVGDVLDPLGLHKLL
ncbi:MAG: hypothetical protein ACRDGQ_07605 [Candidatus Limnocylindrales bacterium]